jgi:hypothetical protein
MSRALLSAMPGAAFADGLAGLMKKIEKALAPRVRAFLDELPGVIKVKPGALKKHQKNYSEIVARLIEASSGHRVAGMRYFSASSNREKDYVVHPTTSPTSTAACISRRTCPSTGRLGTSPWSASAPSHRRRRHSSRRETWLELRSGNRWA